MNYVFLWLQIADDLEDFCMVLWSIWLDRNSRVIEGMITKPEDVATRAGRLLGEFLSCNSLDGIIAPSTQPVNKRWQPPSCGIIKINVDVAVCEGTYFIGIGVVVRDDSGVVLGTMARRMIGSFTPHIAACMAVREGVWFARARGFLRWVVETDAINIACAVFPPSSLSVEANVLEDIHELLSFERGGDVSYGSRKGNAMAPFLVRYAISNSISIIWLDVLPKLLGAFVKSDIISIE